MRLLALLLLCLLWSVSAQAETVTLAADVWCPYNCEPGSPKPGIAIEIAHYAFDPLGITLEYKVMPWARAKEEGRAGHISGIIGAFKEDARILSFPTMRLPFREMIFS